MRYWWVNQKQTHRHEIDGGYLWSPKRRSDGTRNQFYENMKVLAPGDVVFCYWEGAVRAQGSLRSFGYDAPKPVEFGDAGRNWSQIGYRADVAYLLLNAPVRPRDEWLAIQPLLPSKYSPLHLESGKGLQSVYLAALPNVLGELLSELAFQKGNPTRVSDARALQLASMEQVEREQWEQHQIRELLAVPVAETEREAIIRARRGQGRFRENVASVETACRITGITNTGYLIASHIKPWRHAENDERLSRHNGLMLAPHADFLFDRGFISFSDGRLLISEVADPKSLTKLGIDPDRTKEVGAFNDQQEQFLEFHRREIFRRAG
jgi:putative restriction endonuclease